MCHQTFQQGSQLPIWLADNMVTQEAGKLVSLHCCFFRPSKTAQAAEQRTTDAQSMDPSMQGLMWDSEAEQKHQSRASVHQEAGAMPQPKAKKSGPSVPFVGKAASQSIRCCFGIISWLMCVISARASCYVFYL